MISYAQLVDLAFAAHDPERPAFKQQYASLVLAHDDEQLAIAHERAARVSAACGRQLSTRIERLGRFWPAEDYHQKYYLRNDRVLMGDFLSMYGEDQVALRESTAAARINGYVSGDGAKPQLAREIDFLGLSDVGRSRLVARVSDGHFSGGCSTSLSL